MSTFFQPLPKPSSQTRCAPNTRIPARSANDTVVAAPPTRNERRLSRRLSIEVVSLSTHERSQPVRHPATLLEQEGRVEIRHRAELRVDRLGPPLVPTALGVEHEGKHADV